MTDTTVNDTPAANQFIIPAEAEANAAAQSAAEGTATPEANAEDDTEVEKTPEETAAAKAAAKEAFKRRRAEREAGASQQKIADLEAQVRALAESKAPADKKAVADAPKKPNPADYDLGRWDLKYEADLSDWMDAREEHILAQAEARAKNTTKDMSDEAARSNELHSLTEKANKVGERGIDKYDDFEEVVQDALTAMPPAPEALKELVSLPNAEDVFYHLAQNPDALEKITDMSPMGQALEFGKISARLAAKAKISQSVTKAKPSPQQPRGSSGQYSTESDANYEKLLKAAQNPWR